MIAREPLALQMTSQSMERLTKSMTYTYTKPWNVPERLVSSSMTRSALSKKECNLFGMLYTPDGVKPSPDKVRAIENLEPPKDKKELHTFLGMATYMSSFIPNLADHTAPLRNLLKENVDFAWNPSHLKAFEKVKSEMNQLSFTLTHQVRAWAQLSCKKTSQ